MGSSSAPPGQLAHRNAFYVLVPSGSMNDGFWYGILIVCFLFLLVLAFSYPFLEPGSPSYVVLHLGAAHLLVAMGIIGSLLYFDWDPFEPLR